MNTLHLRYVVEVEKTSSISKAAENLYMAQPNLSKAIKELEDTVGISIFERTSKGVVPTPKGQEFLMYARNILAEIEKMESIYKKEGADWQGMKLSIPRGSYISEAFVNFVSELDLNREIDIHIQETGSVKSIINVAESSFNLGIVRYQQIYEKYFLDFMKEKGLVHELIWEFEYLAVMSGKHAMANSRHLKYEELLRDSIEIVHGDTVVPYVQVPELKRPLESGNAKSKRIYVYERGNQFGMLQNIPASFMLVSPIPQSMIDNYGLVQRKIEMQDNSYKDVLIYRRGYSLSEFEQRFVNRLYETKNKVLFKEYN